jgi:D-3-phosphoglycerate dehydrogenase
VSDTTNPMATFRILVPVAAPANEIEGRYAIEMESLAGLDTRFVECHKSEAQFVSEAQTATAVYVRGVSLTRRMIEALDGCRVIAVGSVGVECVDVEAATERGIPVTNCPDTFTEEVADHTMMLLLAAHRRAVEQDRIVRTGLWEQGRKQLLKIPRLCGLTLGLVGFGRIGRAVALRARSFGLRIIACDPFVDETTIVQAAVEPTSLVDLLTRSDFVSLHLPATPETKYLLGLEQLRQMKPTAIVINTGRGSTIDEDALIKALQEGWIAGAGLDVFAVEPIGAHNPLVTMTNIILSPHAASASTRFDPARKRRVGQELALVLKGRWPMSCVNPSVLPASGLKAWQPTLPSRPY